MRRSALLSRTGTRKQTVALELFGPHFTPPPANQSGSHGPRATPPAATHSPPCYAHNSQWAQKQFSPSAIPPTKSSFPRPPTAFPEAAALNTARAAAPTTPADSLACFPLRPFPEEGTAASPHPPASSQNTRSTLRPLPTRFAATQSDSLAGSYLPNSESSPRAA